MAFKYPAILYTLFLLIIPIIIHLFQLRKFKKTQFTNVSFLKTLQLETRKSSQIKKWLILASRILFLTCLILAFAQPFFKTQGATSNAQKETVIYLDNSFSMQVKGDRDGSLLNQTIQDLIRYVPQDQKISFVTNDDVFKNTTLKAIQNDVLQIHCTSTKLTREAALLKCKSLFSNNKNVSNQIIFISDFQKDDTSFSMASDTTTQIKAIHLKPVETYNTSVDSVFISKRSPDALELKVLLNNTNTSIENLPISLYNKENLISKAVVNIKTKSEAIFSVPTKKAIEGKLVIDDGSLSFDNTLYFNVNEVSKTNVLVVNHSSNDGFLKRIYTEDEFNYSAINQKQLNYSILNEQDLIILNELDSISSTLVAALKLFVHQGGFLAVIPSDNIDVNSYNTFLENYNTRYLSLNNVEKRINTIHYDHPLFQKVFEREVKNFQNPKVNCFYSAKANTLVPVLDFEDGRLFLGQASKAVFMFTSPLSATSSTFKNSPIIVPTFYNLGKQGYKTSNLYYDIGVESIFYVEVETQQDAVLSLNKTNTSFIPRQQSFNNKISVTTFNDPSVSGIYEVVYNNQTIKHISYNYNRTESDLTYTPPIPSKYIEVNDSIETVFNAIKSESSTNDLWKWCVVFAILFLVSETLILKFYKK